MFRKAVFALGIVTTCTLAFGCSGSSGAKPLEGKDAESKAKNLATVAPADSLYKDFIADKYALADAFEEGDEAKMKEVVERMKATAKKLEDLKLSDDEMKKLKEKYKEEFEKAELRMVQAAYKRTAPPGAFLPGMYKKIGPDTPLTPGK
jgi:hypothetical protein